MGVKAQERIEKHAAAGLREAVHSAFGQEILAVGRCGQNGKVTDIAVAARGNASQVPALYMYMERGDVVIHNHPSGNLSPSDADLAVASRIGNQGIGFFIIDNSVDNLYAVAEPVREKPAERIEPGELSPYLDAGGKLSKILPDFIPRTQQQQMLETVLKAFNDKEYAVIEAGTGVGKSFAYLLPAAVWAERNQERIIVSTHTINLQQQIIEKDIPIIKRALGSKVKAVLAKGRSNYICLRRLQDAIDEIDLFPDMLKDLQALREWAERSGNGSRSDLSFFPSPQLWQTVCSEADACLGLKCPYREKCFVLKARKEAASADIIVANHHLIFADLAMRIEEVGFESTAVLPPCKRFIYDEAHTIEECATSFFSQQVNRFILGKQFQRLARKQGKKSSGVLMKIKSIISDEKRLTAVQQRIREVNGKYDALEAITLTWLGDRSNLLLNYNQDTVSEEPAADPAADIPFIEPYKGFQNSLLSLLDELFSLRAAIPDSFLEEPEVYELDTVIRRLETISGGSHLFIEGADPDQYIYWIERKRSSSGEYFTNYVVTPMSVSSIMKEAVFSPNKTIVCTSATLTVRNSFINWLKKVGLNDSVDQRVQTCLLDSPFPFDTNVLLSVPVDAPLPNQETFLQYSAETVQKICEITEGRALVLFTSYSMLNHVYDAVVPALRDRGITCMKQGDDDRGRLLTHFTADISSVLFATDSFWQGVDAPGEACKAVVLCRLPFKVPTEPVIKARMEMMKRQGRNPFFEMSLPDAVMKLKQGFGRLIRKQNDSGIVVVLDSRIVRKNYGRFFLESLPRTRRTFKESARVLEEIERFLY